MDRHFDIIVVGAGPGGSAAAALLAAAGRKVLLLDKNVSAGGRMMTIHDKEGFHYELFPINGCPAEGAMMDHVLGKIGKEDAVKRIRPKELGLKDTMYMMNARASCVPTKWGNGREDSSSLWISPFNPRHIGGLLRARKMFKEIMGMPESEIDRHSKTSAMEFVDRYGPFPGLSDLPAFPVRGRLRDDLRQSSRL
jgi:protoporphyrinogen oxidase